MITVGEQAPDFTLTGTRGQSVAIADFLTAKRALLLFYPRGHAGCCGDRLPSGVVTGMIDQLTALDTQPIGIAVDHTLSPKSFMASLDLGFPLLVDSDKAVHDAYGALTTEKGEPQRVTVVIGKDGLILMNQWGSPSPEELLALLGEAADEPITPAD